MRPTDQDESPNPAESLARRPEPRISKKFLNPLLLASIVEVKVESHRDGHVRIIAVIIWVVLVIDKANFMHRLCDKKITNYWV